MTTQTRATEKGSIWHVLGRFMPYYTPDRWRIVTSLACGVLASTLLIAAAWPIRALIDNVLLGQPAGGVVANIIGRGDVSAAAIALAALSGLLAVAAALASAAEKNINASLREAMTARLRVSLLNDVLVRPLARFSQLRSGELTLRVVDDTGHVARLYCKTAPTILRYGITLIVALATLFAVNMTMGVTGTLIVAVLAAQVAASSGRLQSSSRAKRQTEGSVAGLTQEILRNIRFIRAAGGEASASAAFEQCNRQALSSGVKETRAAVNLERRTQIFNAIATFIVTGIAAWLVTRKVITVGDLTLCLTALAQLFKPVEKLNELTSTVTSALTRAERLADFLPDGVVVPNNRHVETIAASPAASLRLEGVSFGHDGHELTLRDINLSIEPGEAVWIRGPSGAGKSTFIDVLLRLVDPSQGQLSLNGRAASQWGAEQWRSHFAVAQQAPYLFAGSIGEAIRFGNQPLSDAVVWQALDLAGVGDLVRSLPGGLGHSLSEAALNLSGGQRAKLSLARALAGDRPILVLDEPLANLDPESQEAVLAALRSLRSRKTIVFVSHQPAPSADFDRILVLANGRLRVEAPLARAAS